MSAGLGLNIVLATAGKVKQNKSHDIDAWGFDQLCTLATFPIVSPGAGLTNATSQGTVFLAQSYKIAKVGVYCSAIDALMGDSFNIYVGTGTPDASGSLNSTAPADTQRVSGYPTAFAAAGDLVFSNDVAFSVANFPNLATSTGGYNEFTPYNYDGCYLPGPLTLYVNTNASTGSITNLLVTLVGCYIDTNCASNLGGDPGVDF